jgi:uncharacterized membrane protein YfcA
MEINLIIIFIIVFLVRIVTTMFGGGGMIILPLLIFMGLSPSEAVASNRVGSQSVNISLFKFHKEKQLKIRVALIFLIPIIIGSFFGGLTVVYINQELFKRILGIIILLSLPLLLFKKEIGIKEFKFTKRRIYISMPFAVIAGFIGGAFASTGLWFTYLYLFAGLTMIQAAGTKKITGMALGLTTIIIFIWAGLVNWAVALTIMAASAIGAWFGVTIGIKAGNIWVKRLFALVVLLSAIKLIFF